VLADSGFASSKRGKARRWDSSLGDDSSNANAVLLALFLSLSRSLSLIHTHTLSRSLYLSISLSLSRWDSAFGDENKRLRFSQDNTRVLRAVICAGLYPNVVRVQKPETTYVEQVTPLHSRAAAAPLGPL